MRFFTGLDGCKAGWVMTRISSDGEIQTKFIDSLEALADHPGITIALIDIPIGFPLNRYRRCDVLSRSLLKPRRHHSIFYTPIKSAVFAESYRDACDRNFEKTGKKISLQAYHIGKKIRETYHFMKKHPQIPLYESHPELCFYGLQGFPCRFKKRHREGVVERLRIIRDFYPTFADHLGNLILNKTFPAKDDDILDSAVLAIAASRTPNLVSVPDEIDWDPEGLRRNIYYYDRNRHSGKSTWI